MGLLKRFFNNTGRPEGLLGKMVLNGMNSSHAHMADWGMGKLALEAPADMVDIGCGGGRNAKVLMKRYGTARMTAVDHSELSVEKTALLNANEVKAGRCRVMQGNAAVLDLPDGMFDLATAFETIYFWPGLERCFSQVLRVLKKGGFFLIVNEIDGEDEGGRKWERMIDGMKIYRSKEISAALKRAGFSVVREFHHPHKPWIAVIAEKQ